MTEIAFQSISPEIQQTISKIPKFRMAIHENCNEKSLEFKSKYLKFQTVMRTEISSNKINLIKKIKEERGNF